MDKRSLGIGFLIGWGLNYLVWGLGLMSTPVPTQPYQLIVGGIFLVGAIVAWGWYYSPWHQQGD